MLNQAFSDLPFFFLNNEVDDFCIIAADQSESNSINIFVDLLLTDQQSWFRTSPSYTIIEENGGQFQLSEMVRASDENLNGLKHWSVADTVTAATNPDFKDYFDLVQSALGLLKTQ